MNDFKTVGDMKKYFTDVERRFEAGELVPTSLDGEADRDRMLIAVTEIARMIIEEHNKAAGGDQHSFKLLLDLVDIRTKLTLLLGKFEGFRYGTSYILMKAGSACNYVN
jgi:hypothetical protein